MWLGTLGLVVKFLSLLAIRYYGSLLEYLFWGLAAGFALLVFSGVTIARGQFKRNRELPLRFELWNEEQRRANAILRRTNAIGVTLLFVGVMINFTQSLLRIHWLDSLWGLVLVLVGLWLQFFGQAKYLERLA
jgi:hypothetical protein